MTTRNRVGFTLVELLVVIAIIVVLVSLVVPALLGARSRARVVTCTNNLWELSSAVLQYDSVKQRLPGIIDRIQITPVASPPTYLKVSWVPILFPYLDRMDLWEGGWRSGSISAPRSRIKRLVCPDDQPTVASALTYVVSISTVTGPPARAPLFGDYSAGTTNAISLSDVTSPTQTVMLSEKIDATRDYASTDPALTPATNPVTPAPTAALLGFTWLTTGKVNSILPSIHPDIVIVSFCDGHVVSVADDVDCNLYFP